MNAFCHLCLNQISLRAAYFCITNIFLQGWPLNQRLLSSRPLNLPQIAQHKQTQIMHLEIHDILKTCNQREPNGEPRTLEQALWHLYSMDPLPPNTICLVHAGKPHWANALFLIVLGRDPGLTILASARKMTEGTREDG